MDTTYNGWTNYATWGVALVLNNDEGTHYYVRERLETIKDDAPRDGIGSGAWGPDMDYVQREFADFLKDYTEELCGLEIDDDTGPTLMARQVIQAGLAEVDWAEIAGNTIDES